MNDWRDRWNRGRLQAFETPVLASWYRTRRRRRILVLLVAAGLALVWAWAILSWAIAPEETPLAADLALLAGMLLLYLPGVTALNAATRGSLELPERYLDERQLGERLRAVHTAHRLGTLPPAVLAVAALVVGWGREATVPVSVVFLLLLALALTHFVLPLLVAGWRMSDPPADEEEAGAA